MLVIPNSMKLQATTARTQAQALCWKITLHDTGTVYRFTDWPHQLELREADESAFHTYTPTDGIDGSARRREDELQPSNKEVRGVVTSSVIKASDLRAGLFDGAQIDEFLVDARTAWSGYIEHTRYWIKSVKYDRGLWFAQIDGLPAHLSQPVGESWSPLCLVDLFSPACGLNVASFEKVVEVTSVVEQRRKFQLSMSGGVSGDWADDGHADDGTILWTSGDNDAITHEVKEYTEASGTITITLHRPTPFDIAVGDDAKLRPGCNKKMGTNTVFGNIAQQGDCKHKFNNLVNFQGYPFIPGRDEALKGSPAR